ncbi:hypothetical protein IE4771_PB00081 (plasmid) [Rhizobium etli bv. mimosae str. IE4771]|uniref:Uncharacterized protein n=1 Tax=Rhizobium etli bv. mimosae str. IE4771 TaxID=1432050 RepID=A0A060ICL9_RHIET|nr:hypothetical protein IE4771_PB00081 [Rhizobium sp. IE4771]
MRTGTRFRYDWMAVALDVTANFPWDLLQLCPQCLQTRYRSSKLRPRSKGQRLSNDFD